MHSRNFGCHVSVRPPVHSLGGGEKGIRCQPIGGGVCYIFSEGNLCNPRFSGREIAQEMAWPLSLR